MRIQRSVKLETAEELERFFGPEGGIAKRYGGEFRRSQIEMALTLN